MKACPLSSLVIVLLIGSIGLGQLTAVSPREFADTEMLGVADLTGFPSYRLQQVYDASDFAGLGPGPLKITRIDWRPDGDVTEPMEYTTPAWTMSFSTTSLKPGELSPTFADNIGTDSVVVIDGPVKLETANLGPVGGPKAFDYGVDLTTPFEFDPSKGNLLMDLTVIDAVGPVLLDFTGGPSASTSFYWTGTLGVDSPIAEGDQFGGHVIQFSVVPEPSSNCLYGLVLTTLLFGRRRRTSCD